MLSFAVLLISINVFWVLYSTVVAPFAELQFNYTVNVIISGLYAFSQNNKSEFTDQLHVKHKLYILW